MGPREAKCEQQIARCPTESKDKIWIKTFLREATKIRKEKNEQLDKAQYPKSTSTGSDKNELGFVAKPTFKETVGSFQLRQYCYLTEEG